MMSSYAASLGLAPYDAAFWMPLVLFLLVGLMVLGTVIFDGFDIGVGLILPLTPAPYRQAVLASLAPWRSVNETWVLLTFGLTLASFPFALGVILKHLYVPLLLYALGIVLRSISFEFRARSQQSMRSLWLILFWLGALFSALGLGLALAAFASGYEQNAANLGFIVFVALCVVSACILLGACWLVMRWAGEIRLKAAHWAGLAARWTAAGMTAVSIMLALANPAILYKWTHINNLMPAGLLWGVMLACFVVLDIQLKHIHNQRQTNRLWVPFVLSTVLLALMLCGIIYSLFPFLVLDEITLWDAVPSEYAMRLILAALIVVAPVLWLRHLSNYRLIFSPPGARL